MKQVSEMPTSGKFVAIGQYKQTPCAEMLAVRDGEVYGYDEIADDWVRDMDKCYFTQWDHLQYYVAS